LCKRCGKVNTKEKVMNKFKPVTFQELSAKQEQEAENEGQSIRRVMIYAAQRKGKRGGGIMHGAARLSRAPEGRSVNR
jgi:hypothetical protein